MPLSALSRIKHNDYIITSLYGELDIISRGVATIEATEAAASPKKYYQAQLAALYRSIISLYCLYLGLFKCPYYNVVNGLTYVCNLDFNSRSRIAR